MTGEPYTYFDEVVETELRAKTYEYGAGVEGRGVQVTLDSPREGMVLAVRLPRESARRFAWSVLADVGGRRLTDREVKVLTLAARGYDTAQIAAALCYAERTVKNHIRSAMAALGALNRTQAVAVAIRAGLLPDDGAAVGSSARPAAAVCLCSHGETLHALVQRAGQERRVRAGCSRSACGCTAFRPAPAPLVAVGPAARAFLSVPEAAVVAVVDGRRVPVRSVHYDDQANEIVVDLDGGASDG